MADVEIREFNRDDFSLVRELYFTVKNRYRSERYDLWNFFETPWGNSIGIIAIDGGICVSAFILRPVMLDIGGKTVLGAQATDLMTHPNYRGRGLFLTLVEKSMRIATIRGLDVIYTFPNMNSYPGFVRRLNFDHVGDVSEWKYEIRSFPFSFPCFGPGKHIKLEVRKEEIKLSELSSLIKAINNERDMCRIKRDKDWLEWRYLNTNGELYQWHIARDSDGKIQAAVLVGEHDSSWGGFGSGELRIHEIFFISEYALIKVLKDLTHCAKRASKTILKTFVKDVKIESALLGAGFINQAKHPLLVRRLNKNLLKGNVHNFDAWRITGGDF